LDDDHDKIKDYEIVDENTQRRAALRKLRKELCIEVFGFIGKLAA